jgi:hypothetical protein
MEEKGIMHRVPKQNYLSNPLARRVDLVPGVAGQHVLRQIQKGRTASCWISDGIEAIVGCRIPGGGCGITPRALAICGIQEMIMVFPR